MTIKPGQIWPEHLQFLLPVMPLTAIARLVARHLEKSVKQFPARLFGRNRRQSGPARVACGGQTGDRPVTPRK